MRQTLNRRRSFPHRPRRLRAQSGGEILSVTFPSSPLTTQVWIALGADLTASRYTWNWLNITEYVRHDLGITVESGRRDVATRVSASRCQLKLANPAGIFSRRNPMGPYYGLLGGKVANVPIWIELNPGDGYRTMYEGYINDLPTRWTDASGSDSYVVIQCAGILRQLEQGEDVAPPLNRTILADAPVHFWRMDDPAGSPVFFSSMPNGGIHMVPDAGVSFAEIESPPGGDGTTSAASFDDGVSARAANLNAAPPFTVEWAVRRPVDGSADGAQVFAFTYVVDGVEASFTAAVVEDASVSEREWYHFMVQASQVGANWEMYWWKNGIAQGLATSGAGTLSRVDAVRPGGSPAVTTDLSLGYVVVYDHHNVDAQSHSEALQAYAGELAHIRFLRMCAELGITGHCTAATSASLGPQPSGTGLEILRDMEKTDGGVLYEHGFGLGFQALSERYNQPVALELDFNQRHIYGTPEPADDDQRFRNQWTVRSTNTGATRTYRDSGYAVTDGLRPDGDSINDNDDTGQLFVHAGFRVRRDTVDEDRWPRLPINLAGTPDLIPAWLATPFGARVNAANPPPEVAPDTIDGIIEGSAQRWDSVSWVAALNVSPASPYQVGRAGDSTTTGFWAQTSGTELAADISSNTTSFDVNVTGPLWTTTPGGQLIRVGGEVMALTGVSGTSSPQTFTVTRSVNGVVKAHSITGPAALRAVKVHRPLVAAY